MRHVFSIPELRPDALQKIVDRAVELAADPRPREKPLAGRIIGIYFRVSSTRTRSSFTAGALNLGAGVIAYGPSDLQIATGETIEDTARVLSGYLDALVIRTNDSLEELRALGAAQNEMAIVNALTRDDHPTQAMADLATLQERFGALDGLHVLYLGEGNSTAISLAQAVARTPGMRLTVLSPEGYGIPAQYLEAIDGPAGQHGSQVEQRHDLGALPSGVDAVYTSRWKTMGVAKSDDDWLDKFRPYKVTAEILRRVSKERGTVFLHDLPAVRGEDVDDEVLDGPQSLAWRQAEHKMFSAMAILEWCLADSRSRSS